MRPSENPGGRALSYQLPIWVWPITLMAVCLISVWRGRDEERLAAGGELATWALSLVAHRAHSGQTEWAILFIDISLLALFFWIAFRSERFWPLFAAAFQLLAVVTHLANSLDDTVSTWAYVTAGLAWNYLALFSIGYGAWTAPRHAATVGAPAPGDRSGLRRPHRRI